MTEALVNYAPPERARPLLGGVAAALEISALVGSSVAAAVYAQGVIRPGLGQALGFGGGTQDLLAAAWALLQQFSLQYGALLVLVAAVGFVRRRVRPAAYALGRGSLGAGQIIRQGVVLGLVAGLPATVLLLLQTHAPIGTDTPMWAALRDAPKDLSFWAFLAVGSFALVPLLEELTWRGYVLGRLTEAVAPGAAVLAAAAPFALLHTQYASADPAMILAQVSVMTFSLAGAFLTLRTGTLWPAVIGHFVLNFPIEFGVGWVRLALGVVVIVVFARPLLREVSRWAKILFRRDTLQALPLLAVFAAVGLGARLLPAHAPWILGAAAVAGLASAVMFRSAWSQPRGGARPDEADAGDVEPT
ncbi:MAG TPA: CPBP family intramembrane glutamic endopeptidase [Caulobacteraceae bacterium]